MKFGLLPVAESQDAILAHTLYLNGRTIKKGIRLTAEHLDEISAAGLEHITVARLEDGDVDEDSAAAFVAKIIAGDLVEPCPAKAGRCNLSAKSTGLLLADTERINRINTVNEAVTVATLPAFSPVSEGDVVATIKVIPYAVEASVMDRLNVLADTAIWVRPLEAKRIGLVLTRVPGGRESLVDKAAKALGERLERFGLQVGSEIRCNHDEKEVGDAIRHLGEERCTHIFVFGAAAASDRKDVVPAGIERSGGRVIHLGMPVEPGNLLVLGKHDGVPVIGMPGCARSAATNGFDWVMNRVLAGIDVSPQDIMGMGVGGLLSGRTGSSRRLASKRREEGANRFSRTAPEIGAVILAAGQSRRMGGTNKLTAEAEGKPMVRRVAEAALASQAACVIAVTGHDREAVESALKDLEVDLVHTPDAERGMSESLKAGIRALPVTVDGAIICLGDMPRVSAAHIDRLIERFDPGGGAAICIASHRGKRGNPVLWAREFFGEMLGLEGDTGARALIRKYDTQAENVEMDDAGVLTDFDRPEDFNR